LTWCERLKEFTCSAKFKSVEATPGAECQGATAALNVAKGMVPQLKKAADLVCMKKFETLGPLFAARYKGF
jgi:hypothetical protein